MKAKYKVTPSLLDSFLALATEDWMDTARFVKWLSEPFMDNEATIAGKFLHHVAQTGRIERVGQIQPIPSQSDDQPLIIRKGGITAKIPRPQLLAAMELFREFGPRFYRVEMPVSAIVKTRFGGVEIRGRVDAILDDFTAVDFKFGARAQDYSGKLQWKAYCHFLNSANFIYLHAYPNGKIATTKLWYQETDRLQLIGYIERCIEWMNMANLTKYITP